MNFLRFNEKKPFLITITICLFLITGLLGGKWQQAYATTTIPKANSISPNEVIRNSSDVTFTIKGADFIGEWGVEWTRIRWRGPDGQIYTVIPNSVSVDEILVNFPWFLFSQQGVAKVEVINHPEDPDLIEISEELDVHIVDLTFLPYLAK